MQPFSDGGFRVNKSSISIFFLMQGISINVGNPRVSLHDGKLPFRSQQNICCHKKFGCARFSIDSVQILQKQSVQHF